MDKLSTIISDSDGGMFHDVREIIVELKSFSENMDTMAMSPERTAYLLGRKSMLEDVIEYLKKIST